MDKIKRFVECHIPVTTCNLRCHYCYITQQLKFSDKLPAFKYSPEHIARALSVERMGGICMLNMCGGGETLLPPEMTDIIRCCLEAGHYITVVTNGTVSKRFDELSALPKELLERLFFKFSFQFLELKKKNLLDKFFDNINKMRQAGCSFSLEITPNDELIPYFEEIKKIALEKVGALPHITIARADSDPKVPMLTKYSKKEFAKIWGQFDSAMLKFKLPVFGEKRNEFCYAGDWSCCINFGSGQMSQCYHGKALQNVFENIEEPIRFCAVGHCCPQPHCYNAHSFLTWGDIPEMKSPTYCDMRNRVSHNGGEWVNGKMKEFMSSKLVESNHEYSKSQKKEADEFSRIAPRVSPFKYYRRKILETLHLRKKH